MAENAGVDSARLGRAVQVVRHSQVDRVRYGRNLERILDLNEILACHGTAAISLLRMEVALASMEARIGTRLSFSKPATQRILSTPIPRRMVSPTDTHPYDLGPEPHALPLRIFPKSFKI